jgi:hypothetical protein
MLSQASTSRGVIRRDATAGLLAGAGLAGLLAGAALVGEGALAPAWLAAGVGVAAEAGAFVGAGALVGVGGGVAPQADDQATTRPEPARPVSWMNRRRER